MNLFTFFIVLSIINVIGGTIKSILTINGNKFVASLANALYFGFYTVVIIYMNCELSLFTKVIVTAICNFIGVFIVKFFEEKARKDRLWKIEFTVKKEKQSDVINCLETANIPYNYIEIGKHTAFNTYSASQAQSITVRNIITNYDGKYFVTESKNLY